MTSALPPAQLLQLQAEWLAPARARLLRRIGIARRRSILDLGAGTGAVTGELRRRGGGPVVALDLSISGLKQVESGSAVCGDAPNLPFRSEAFDLVFCQCVLMWLSDVETALAEVVRVLQPGGVFVALEPDYGGLIEYPVAIAARDLWLSTLGRAGARPRMGRRLPQFLAQAGFQVQVNLMETVTPPAPQRLAFLRGLPLTTVEETQLAEIEAASGRLTGTWEQVVHLPFFLITGTRQAG